MLSASAGATLEMIFADGEARSVNQLLTTLRRVGVIADVTGDITDLDKALLATDQYWPPTRAQHLIHCATEHNLHHRAEPIAPHGD